MVPVTTSLTRFSGETTWPLGQLKLLVTIGDATHSTKAWMNFMIVKSLSPYNGIIERPGLKAIQAVLSTVHGMLKFLTEKGIVTIRSSLLILAECASVDTASVTPGEKKAHPANLTVPLHPIFPDQEVVVGGSLSDAGRTELCSLLKRNLDIFAWQPSDMTGAPRSIAEHRLNTLKKCIKKSDFRWTTKAEQAFQLLKQHLSALPLLAAPKPQEELIMYLSATHGAISAVLLTERGTAQMPVYFISRALQGPKLNYSPMEKLVLSLVFAAKKLRRYFQAHPIAVITDQPIKQVMSHFLNEIPSNALQGASVAETQEEPWTLFTDGSSCVDGSGAGLILTNPDGVEFTYALWFQFAASNNEAEYEALIADLRIATQMGVKTYKQMLIINCQVPRSKNKKADALSKIASTSFAHLSKQVLVEVLETKSITGKEVTAVIEEEDPTWMTELVNYLKEGTLPEDEKEARKICLKAR
nr:reverse transcriptase domain-containing protein [Tanacetum cinerariifolium]GFA76337.1 reverse transcriptase domain-containing protein [Tanacetum cinerariifolium]